MASGVKNFIKDNLPSEWDVVLRKHKCLGSFIDQFYNSIAEEKNKNKYYYKITLQRAKHYMLRFSISHIAIHFNFKEGIKFWQNIQNEVMEYKCMLN